MPTAYRGRALRRRNKVAHTLEDKIFRPRRVEPKKKLSKPPSVEEGLDDYYSQREEQDSA